MEGLGFTWFDGLSNVVRRKRSQTSRRPRPVLLSTSGSRIRVKKVKLKFGGVTRMIQTNATSNSASREKQQIVLLQSNSDNNNSPSDKRRGLQGLPWKNFSKGDFGLGKEKTLMGRISRKSMSKEGDKFERVRKSKRVPRRRVHDGEFIDEDYEDDDRVYEEDTDYEDEEELGSDVELEDKKKQKQRKESVDVLMDSMREMTLTRRQRALLSSKDASASGASLIEFPIGLPPAPPRKQKESFLKWICSRRKLRPLRSVEFKLRKLPGNLRLKLSEKYLVRTPVERREKRK